MQNNLFVKAIKCDFYQSSTSFLGFIISPNKITMDISKISAVLDWPTPKDKKQLQRFLGFTSFYHTFIKGYSHISAPLHALTSSKTSFCWNEQAEHAFNTLKKLSSSAPILHSTDSEQQFIVEVDASNTGVGAVLSQCNAEDKTHPCAYFF